MAFVHSADGTRIVYDQAGAGSVLVLVDGALTTRNAEGKAELVSLLAPDFTVVTYDRRARGDSDDCAAGQPPRGEREIEDLAALLAAIGGRAFLYGHSSGAALVLEAAAALGPVAIPRIALYEPPYSDDPAAQAESRTFGAELGTLLAAHRHDDAVARFMAWTGAPPDQIASMRTEPWFRPLAAAAPSMAYDLIALLDDGGAIPIEVVRRVTVPVLVMSGEATFPFMIETARQLAALLPHGALWLLPGESHEVRPASLAPALITFLGETP